MAKQKYVFKVECLNQTFNKDDEVFDMADFKVHIRKGVTGTEMAYALTSLLQVILSHEVASGNEMTIDGFTNFLNLMLKDVMIGVPESND